MPVVLVVLVNPNETLLSCLRWLVAGGSEVSRGADVGADEDGVELGSCDEAPTGWYSMVIVKVQPPHCRRSRVEEICKVCRCDFRIAADWIFRQVS